MCIQHTHPFGIESRLEYGIYRDQRERVFQFDDLEYSVNRSDWFLFVDGVNGFEELKLADGFVST